MTITDEDTLRVLVKLLDMQREQYRDSAMGAMLAERRRQRKRQNRMLLGLGGRVGRDRTQRKFRRPRDRTRNRRGNGWDYLWGGWGAYEGWDPYDRGYRRRRGDRTRRPTQDTDWNQVLQDFQRMQQGGEAAGVATAGMAINRAAV